MVLPGSGRSFAQFQSDDGLCRSYALARIGATPGRAGAEHGVATAAIVTGVGAAAGAAIGAAVGDPGGGALVGAGSGLLVGSAAGVSRGDAVGHAAQERYDQAYLQCMYANGNQIPVPRGSLARGSAAPPSRAWPSPPPPPGPAAGSIPPPPPGPPPPPPLR
jgi:hypothetical protein